MKMFLITNYRRILNYLQPTKIQIIQSGQITKSGGLELIEIIESIGYNELV